MDRRSNKIGSLSLRISKWTFSIDKIKRIHRNDSHIMRITIRTLCLLLLITVLILAYCSTTVDAGVISRLAHRRRLHKKPTTMVKYKYKVKHKQKYKTKTKIRVKQKRPGLIKSVKRVG